MTDYGTVQERVARGAAYLDNLHKYRGWRPYVDGSIVDLTSSQTCVLGQLAQKHPALAEVDSVMDYWTMLGFLGKTEQWAHEYGFAEPCDMFSTNCDCEERTEVLTAEWRRLLAA